MSTPEREAFEAWRSTPERAAFEAWRSSTNPGMRFDRNMPDGSYNNPNNHVMWDAWQARAALAAPVAPAERMPAP